VLVTHEHSDHAAGVNALARRYDLPVYLTHGTASSGRFSGCSTLRCFNADSQLLFGEMQVDAVAVPHDSREPVQYRFSEAGVCVGILTDLGSITPHVRAAFGSCDLLVLEFNHDRELLHGGPYPAALKRRVGGDWGHLSNSQALALLRSIDLDRLQRLVVAHMSEQNNERARVEALLRDELPALLPILHWAEQDEGFPWLALVSEDVVAAY
jgi:phosphoribosyl 1,2-cyclic phosphodiesterase